MSGGKLYSTESGQLYHAGKLAVCLVGLPARGKTHLSVSLLRYLTWLGLSCKAFHLGDYRRKFLKGNDMPEDYFFFEDDSNAFRKSGNWRTLTIQVKSEPRRSTSGTKSQTIVQAICYSFSKRKATMDRS